MDIEAQFAQEIGLGAAPIRTCKALQDEQIVVVFSVHRTARHRSVWSLRGYCIAIALSSSLTTLGEVRLDPFNTGRFLIGNDGYMPICTDATDGSADIIGGVRRGSTCGIGVLIDGGHVTAYGVIGGTTGFSYGGSTGAFNGLGSIDLTEGGTNDCFNIEFTAVNNKGGSLSFELRNIAFVGSTVTLPLPTSPGSFKIPFSAFTNMPYGDDYPVSFSDVGFIAWGLQMSGGESYTFGPIVATSLPKPQLTIELSSSNIVLTWPTNTDGFVLQSSTNLNTSSFWSTNLPAPVVVADHNAVTNQISGPQIFFRLTRQF